jgi:hypothetical protein
MSKKMTIDEVRELMRPVPVLLKRKKMTIDEVRKARPGTDPEGSVKAKKRAALEKAREAKAQKKKADAPPEKPGKGQAEEG